MKAIPNPFLDGLSGQMNNIVFRMVRGKVVIARRPTLSSEEPSANQLEQRERFAEAASWGKSVMADSDLRAMYEEKAEEKGVPVFSLTIADFFNTPTIRKVDVFGYNGNVGDTITVRASDDVGVAKVHVSISALDGSPIENGEAVETGDDSGTWIYTATVQGQPTAKIQVVAVDHPGGTSVMNVDKTF